MKRGFSYTISVIAGLLMIVSILFTCLEACMLDEGWFLAEYVKLDTARSIKMTTTDVAASTKQLVDYMDGSAESIQIKVKVNGKTKNMFNKKEIQHMLDVRALYQGFRTFRNVAVPVSAALFAAVFFLMRRDSVKVVAKGFIVSSCIFGVLGVAVALWVAVDFTSFWTAFHRLFFTNDLWLLDPRTSRMIQICPQQLFLDFVVRFGSIFIVIMAVLVVLGAIYLYIRASRRRAALVVGEKGGYDDV